MSTDIDWEQYPLQISRARNVNGTYLQGYVEATYEELIETFGEPERGDGDKTQVEWALDIHDVYDDRVYTVTIYDWKTGLPPEEVKRWNVGGYNYHAADIVEAALRSFKPIEWVEPTRAALII